jgi:putative thioredoxin
MSGSSPYVADVAAESFEQTILQAPADQTVLVDFWAEWCGPCKMLGPVLERIAESYKGKVFVAKINVDENPQLSQQFSVQGIPAVKIFQEGKIVEQFVGALPEMQIRSILEKIVKSESDNYVVSGNEALENNKLDEAKELFQKALDEDTNHNGAKIGLAKVALKQNDFDKARELANSIELGNKEHDEAQAIINQITFSDACIENGGKEAFIQQLQDDENNLDARYALAHCLAAEGKYQEALEELLAVVKKDKKYNNGAAKDAMVKIFSVIGQRSKLADEYRNKLEWILY